MIDISGLDKGAILAALYNASHPQGMGFLHYDPTPMTAGQGNELLKRTANFDYLKGRVMKINLSSDTLDPTWYDRDNWPGAAEEIIERMVRQSVNTDAA